MHRRRREAHSAQRKTVEGGYTLRFALCALPTDLRVARIKVDSALVRGEKGLFSRFENGLSDGYRHPHLKPLNPQLLRNARLQRLLGPLGDRNHEGGAIRPTVRREYLLDPPIQGSAAFISGL